MGNVSVACVIVWLCFLVASFSGCCLIVGRLWYVSVCFYRCVSVAWEIADGSLWKVSVCFLYRCVSVAWEIADGRLWKVSVCFLSVCVGCLGDRAYCCLLVLPPLLLILPLLHNTLHCYIEPALAPNVKDRQQNAIHLRHQGCPLTSQTSNAWGG